MRVLYYSVGDPQQKTREFKGDRLRIGRGKHNDLVLTSPYVAEDAAELRRRDGVWEVVVLGRSVYYGDELLAAGSIRVVGSERPIRLPPFTLELDLPSDAAVASQAKREIETATLKFVQDVHLELLQRMQAEPQDLQKTENEIDAAALKRWEDEIDRVSDDLGLTRPGREAWLDFLAGEAVRARLLEQIAPEPAAVSPAPSSDGDAGKTLAGRKKPWSRLITSNLDLESQLEHVCRFFRGALALDAERELIGRITKLEQGFAPAWEAQDDHYHAEFKLYLARRRVKKLVKELVFGYGPLEDLLALPTVSEIMVVDAQRIYVEKNGRLQNSGQRFASNKATENIIKRIVEDKRVNRQIDKSTPLVDARLHDGSRVNAIIAPLAYSGPCLTIRKFPSRSLTIADLVKLNALTPSVAEFLRAAVVTRRNILISGGTGSGKTTLLACLADYIPAHERIVTVEDTVELRLNHEHVVQLETRNVNVEGKGAYTIRDLVRNSLRMRPDRIVVGECRGAEALDMLQAMNTGHDGSLTTIHANTAADVALRLEVMVQLAAPGLPVASIHRQVATAIDLIVQLRRLRDGRRAVVQVSEVSGINRKSDRVELRDLFLLEETAESPRLTPTGCLPSFMHEL
ncbi:MAG TPA: ATPase, T2SS/T4P/T4SS family, partial [Pirellulales bacterium]